MRWVAERGDIWMVSLDPASGREQKGFRPVMVLSPQAFNKLGLAIVAPITQGGDFARDAGFAANLTGGGTKTQDVVLVNQCLAMDLAARNAKFVEAAPTHIVDDVLARLHAILD